MRDYKLESLQIDPSFRGIANEIKTEPLKTVASAFVENVERVDSLSGMPAGLFFWGSMLGTHYAIAHNRILKSDYNFNVEISENDAKAIESAVGGMTVLAVNKLLKQPSINSRISQEGNENVKKLGRYRVPFLPNALDALLSGVVIGSWTAYETLAADLWIRSVNTFPSSLGMLKGTPNRIRQKMRSDVKSSPQVSGTNAGDGSDSSKILALAKIHEVSHGSFDLRDKMGELWVSSGRVGFTKLTDIREAYSMAFDAAYKKARTDTIDESLADRSLDALTLVRNLLVHKAGCADSIYRTETKGIPGVPQLGDGDRLLLDGQLVSTLVNPVIGCAIKLIKGVDSWTRCVKTAESRRSAEPKKQN